MTVHHDNRDFGILANYQPKVSESLITQTRLFGKGEGVGLLYFLLAVIIFIIVNRSLNGF